MPELICTTFNKCLIIRPGRVDSCNTFDGLNLTGDRLDVKVRGEPDPLMWRADYKKLLMEENDKYDILQNIYYSGVENLKSINNLKSYF